MSSSSQAMSELKAKYFSLSKTIRRVLISGILAVVYAVIDMAIIQPMMEEYSEVTKSIEQAKAQSKSYAAQLLSLQETAGIDPSLSDKQQLEIASEKLSELNTEINAITEKFISPRQMSLFLNELLARSKKLKLISMENMPAEAINVKTTREIPEKTTQKAAKKVFGAPTVEVVAEDTLYKHSIKLKLRGKYTDIAVYLNEVEQMPWRLFWQTLSLKTQSYPYSEITLEIYTLSLQPEWLTL